MNRPLRALLCACLLSFGSGNAVQAASLQYVYKGAGCRGLEQLPGWTALMGKPADGVVDFVDYGSTWTNAVLEADWALGCWQGKVGNIALSVPMAVKQNGGAPLHEVAAGEYDGYFKKIAQSLVAHNFASSYVRLGWEFNGGWYPWAAKNSPSLFAQGFRRAVIAMRSVKGQHFRFIWNSAAGWQQFYFASAYPGDAYVDVVGVDAYNESWRIGVQSGPNVAVEPELWAAVYGDAGGLKDVVAFAKAHRKPYAFPEWGTGERPDGHGGGDDRYFIQKMAPAVAGAEMAGYWDYNASDVAAQISDGSHPLAGAQLLKTQASAPLKALLKAHYVVFSPESSPTLTCIACHAIAVQVGPGRWDIEVFANQLHSSAILAWGFRASDAHLYDPDIGTAPVSALGAASAATLVLRPNHPLVVAVQR